MREKDQQYYQAYMRHNTISRRGLLRGLFGGVKKVHNEAMNVATPRSIPRPPHAVEEGLFQSLCSGCKECESACPEYVINIQDGLAELNLDYGFCSQCGECQNICTTGALSDISTDTQLRPQFSKNCLSLLGRNCNACQSECPHGAIHIKPGHLPVVDNNLCDGCGRCRQTCHMSCITLKLAS